MEDGASTKKTDQENMLVTNGIRTEIGGTGLTVPVSWCLTLGTSTKGSWYYLGSDGAMLKGLQTINGKWYYLDQDGRMATDLVVLTPDQDGALHYPSLAK